MAIEGVMRASSMAAAAIRCQRFGAHRGAWSKRVRGCAAKMAGQGCRCHTIRASGASRLIGQAVVETVVEQVVIEHP